MTQPILSAREMEAGDIEAIANYWLGSDKAHLQGMGVDLAKLPDRDYWKIMLADQLSQPYEEKKSYCIIWQVDGKAVGHCNVNKIRFGEEAYMHLHLWEGSVRKKGFGTALVRLTLPYFFTNLKLKTLFCEPYALNPSPNRTLEKVGFSFVKEHVTIPGAINFEQPVHLWELTYPQFEKVRRQETEPQSPEAAST